MSETENLSSLIGDIYDAAFDPALWPAILAEIVRFVGGQAGGLLTKDSVSRISTVHFETGVDGHYTDVYVKTYSKCDPMTPLRYFDVGQVASTADLISYEEFRRGRFYLEWVKPQRWVDSASIVLEKSETNFAYFSVIRDAKTGMVDAATRRRMRLIAQHVRRAVLIGRSIDLKTVQAKQLADALDGLNLGLFLVDAAGRMAHTNAAGQAILGAGDYLKKVAGRLCASDPRVNQTLHKAFAAAAEGDAAVGTQGIAVPLVAHDGARHVAHVLPLTRSIGRRVARDAVAAVFVRKAALDAPAAPEIIARTYRLTPTELRVLLTIVEVGGVPETADTLGIADSTVKTHLSNVYAKTGTRRQTDLVRLVLGFSSPLRK